MELVVPRKLLVRHAARRFVPANPVDSPTRLTSDGPANDAFGDRLIAEKILECRELGFAPETRECETGPEPNIGRRIRKRLDEVRDVPATATATAGHVIADALGSLCSHKVIFLMICEDGLEHLGCLFFLEVDAHREGVRRPFTNVSIRMGKCDGNGEAEDISSSQEVQRLGRFAPNSVELRFGEKVHETRWSRAPVTDPRDNGTGIRLNAVWLVSIQQIVELPKRADSEPLDTVGQPGDVVARTLLIPSRPNSTSMSPNPLL